MHFNTLMRFDHCCSHPLCSQSRRPVLGQRGRPLGAPETRGAVGASCFLMGHDAPVTLSFPDQDLQSAFAPESLKCLLEEMTSEDHKLGMRNTTVFVLKAISM